MASSSTPHVQPPVLPTSSTTTTTTNTHVNHFQNNNNLNQTPIVNHNYYANNHTINGNNYGANPKKRSLEPGYVFENSPYYKMRVTVTELRPLLLQVLSHPDFKACDAGRALQEKLKFMVDLCRQQAVSWINCKSVAGSRGLASVMQGEPKQSLLQRDISFAPQIAQEKHFPVGNNQTHENYKMPGTYIVGGSAFGWNFLMFHGTKPEYYGRTKESFRAR